METQSNDIKALQILYKALLLGLLLFVLIVMVLIAKGGLTPAIIGTSANIFIYVVIAVAVLSVSMSYKLSIKN